jgi:catechol 2,3-dioxygenase-like lactoylglutathione lyase family enzyme
VDFKLEVVVVPVADVDKAKSFYQQLQWREDADFSVGDGFRVVQFTPPGSECSIIFGTGVTNGEPGSLHGLQLTVKDVVAAREHLLGLGIDVSEVWHDADGVFHHAGTANRAAGPDAARGDYKSWLSFEDPDGNGWFLQEIVTRAAGR